MAIEIITKEDLQLFRLQLLEDLRQLLRVEPASVQKEWLRGSEVRKVLKISQGTLQNLRIGGKLHPAKIGGIYYYPLEEVNNLLESSGN